MKQGFRRAGLAAMLIASLAAGCAGGSGGGGATAGIDPGGMYAVGPITGFGSIFVNGVECSTDKAAIQVDGRSVSESELKLGQVVTVVGTLNEADRTKAVADTVTFTAPLHALLGGVPRKKQIWGSHIIRIR